ncbi:MAG: hypothetical protein ABS48_00690 [Erythrobacter sp. SCN 68-10]|uniref:Transcription factor zinc-finger domain-containing protein n=1 Tax=Sphingopyxis bauzanensis TaxID=651663 RepID=A0A246JJ07_9SPHN|nr:zf-TFIIB domain-containing protein [Sphingopyxis bauzanensis]ODS60660.1 MAG: hypothetical protein ABS48_00690 [Erythrobacter sp. SCN 68-10]OWQ92555.1 hypothetical protein CDQ92_20070 [Sphingopyxis bauzanensis]GGJ61898.1 hypothetical protein GCM10011393_35330 [Sphingopyxis bauzanensis]
MRSAADVAAMPCPLCRTGLTLSDRAGVEIDYCQTCRGVWLDRGELDKIIERSVREAAPPPREAPRSSPGYRPDAYQRDNDYRYRPDKRKKSFLSELFD